MKLFCSECGEFCDVERDGDHYRCSALHEFSSPATPAPRAEPRAEVPPPAGVTVQELDVGSGYRASARKGVAIEFPWPRAQGIGVFVATTFIIVGVPFITSDSKALPFTFWAFAGTVIFASAVYALYTIVNRTTISVDAETVAVRYGPLPWFGAVSIPSSAIEQLWVQKTESKSSKGNRDFFSVKAILAGGDEKILVTFADHRSKARFVEQRLEERLGLPDCAVAGEAD